MSQSLTSIMPLSLEHIEAQIYVIRDKRIMLDRDLALLYGVETKQLKRQVRRNQNRFPSDFMFELTNEEFAYWRSQNVTSNADKMGLRYTPYAFTENGIAMLSSVLTSQKAIQVNIQIMRVFTTLRKQALTQLELLKRLDEIDQLLLNQNQVNARNEAHINLIFDTIKQIIDPELPTKKQYGFIAD